MLWPYNTDAHDQGYEPPTEDADVLVLTAPSSKFVDIRFPKLYEPSKPLAAYDTFWAFSGVSKTSFPASADGFEMPLAAHCVWTHDIDSRGPGIEDEGDMFLLQNGDAMEVGTMQNPKTGKHEMYKEYWTEPAQGEQIEKKLPCVVAEAIDEAQRSQGLIIRIGPFCQGVLRPEHDKDGIVAERFTLDNSKTTWNRDERSGHMLQTHGRGKFKGSILPNLWLCSKERALGDRCEHNGVEWIVIEVSW
jgi:hypothetical protein